MIVARLRRAGWPTASLLVLGMWACQLGFFWRSERLGHADLLDARQWYSPEEAATLLEGLGASGRSLYAWTEISLDLAFPVLYGLLFALLLARVFRYGRVWPLLPLAAAVADLLENALIATLAWTYSGGATPLAWAAAVFTALKSGLLLLALVALLVGSVRALALRG